MAFFSVLALLLTGPALGSFGHRVCAHRVADTWLHLWAFWHAKYAFLGHDLGWLRSGVLTYPGYVPLPIAVVDCLLPILSLPVQFVLGSVTVTFNVLTAGGLVFSCMAGYFLTRSVTGSHGAALAGGVIVGVNPFVCRLIAKGYIEYAWWGVVPLAVLLYRNAMATGTLRRAVVYAVGVLFTVLLSTYCAFYVAIVVMLLFLSQLLRSPGDAKPLAMRFGRLQGIAAIALVPVLAMWAWSLGQAGFKSPGHGQDFIVPPPGDATSPALRTLAGSLDAARLFALPGTEAPPAKPAAGAVRPEFKPFADVAAEEVRGAEWLLVLLLAAGAIGCRCARKDAWVWLAAAVLFFLLALGPHLVWGGDVVSRVRLPYAWLYRWLPGFNLLIVPGRAFFGTILALAVLAGIGLKMVAARIEARTQSPRADARTGAVVASAIFLSFLILGVGEATLPSTDAGVPLPYRQIALDTGRFGVLEMPLRGDMAYRMYCQTVHQRPIYGGMIRSHMIEEQGADAVRRNRLVQLLDGNPPASDPGVDWGASLRELTGLGFRYVVLHPADYAEEARFHAAADRLQQLLGPPLSRGRNAVLWRLVAPLPAPAGSGAEGREGRASE